MPCGVIGRAGCPGRGKMCRKVRHGVGLGIPRRGWSRPAADPAKRKERVLITRSDGTLGQWIAEQDPQELNQDGLFVHALAIAYADPKHHAYPLDAEHIHAAISYFGQYAHRYPKAQREQMAKRILRAALRHGIEVSEKSQVAQIAQGHDTAPGGTHIPDATHSAPSALPTEQERDGEHAQSGVASSNGPQGPHPFPAQTAAEKEAIDRNVGAKELFADIPHVTTWTKDSAEGSLTAFWDFLSVLEQVKPS